MKPKQKSGGDPPDLLPLQFKFYEQLLYADPESKFPNPVEKLGHFLGIAENVGDTMPYWVLATKNTIIARSVVRPIEATRPNHRVEDSIGAKEETKKITFADDDEMVPSQEPEESPHDFDYGGLNEQEEWYFDNINHLEKEEFSIHEHVEDIIGHRRTKDRHIELQVKWVKGDTSWELIDVICKDDPSRIAEYAKKKNLNLARGFTWCRKFLK